MNTEERIIEFVQPTKQSTRRRHTESLEQPSKRINVELPGGETLISGQVFFLNLTLHNYQGAHSLSVLSKFVRVGRVFVDARLAKKKNIVLDLEPTRDLGDEGHINHRQGNFSNWIIN